MASQKADRGTADVDLHVGQRLRNLRITAGLTQEQLALLIGVTYQQAHKYEHGINRMSASRLFKAAQHLKVPIGYFFEGLRGTTEASFMAGRERMTLVTMQNFHLLTTGQQDAVAALVSELARRP